MAEVLNAILEHGSLLVVMLALIIAGFGVPVPEDIMLVAAGVLVARGECTFVEALIACTIGVFVGDTSIFLLARKYGHRLLEVRPFRWIFTEARKQRTLELFQRHGHVIVFMGRHMAGLRMPIFAMSGIYGVKLRTFWLYDGLGLLVSAPAVIGIGYYFAKNLSKIMELLQRVEIVIVLAVLAIGGGYWLLKRRARLRAEERALEQRAAEQRALEQQRAQDQRKSLGSLDAAARHGSLD
jgi:membrane protein DedA with SNARE-associated domain